ncbi:MAG TPA: iron-sulfur cluster assembly protein, partial [Microbacteriaceae bacterium]|nr:iron-sulfur cluster assembly protein [Microbacteriaceae bacterium]
MSDEQHPSAEAPEPRGAGPKTGRSGIAADETSAYGYLVPRIHGALTQVIDPEIRRPITELNMVPGIEVDDQADATVTIRLTTATCPNSR